MRSRAAAVPWALAVVVLVGLALLAPHRGAAALATAELAGAGVAAAVLHRRGWLRTRVGGGIVAVLAVLGTSSALLVVVGPGNAATQALILLGQVVGLATLAPALARHRRATGSPARTGLVGAELAIVVVGDAAKIRPQLAGLGLPLEEVQLPAN